MPSSSSTFASRLLRRLGQSWIDRRVRKTADVQRICLATSDRHRVLRTGVPRGTCQVPGISKTTQAVSISRQLARLPQSPENLGGGIPQSRLVTCDAGVMESEALK